jgi:hypothetical protein
MFTASAKKRRPSQLCTLLARCLKSVGIKKKTGRGCRLREEILNRWSRRLLNVFRHLHAQEMVDFDPRFEIMPGTKAKDLKVVHADPYEAVPRQTMAE